MTTHSRMKNSRLPVAGIIALAGVLALTACGSGGGTATTASDNGSGKGTIQVWGHQGQPGEVASLQASVADFNASQKDVVVKLKLIPEADYTKTVQATSKDKLPDVMEYDGPLLSSFVYDKKMTPLEGLVSTATVSNQTASVKAQNTYTSDGKLYGVGMFDSGLGIYGNKKLLDAAGVTYPTTWQKAWTADEFTAVLQKLAAKDADHKVLDIKENYAGEWPTYGFLPIVSSAGAEVIKDNKASGNLDSSAVVKAVTTFASWKKYTDPNSDDKAFTDGRVALSWVGHWAYPGYAKAMGNDLVVMPLPNFGNGTKSGQGSWGWGITANSKNGSAAGKFLDYLMSDKSVAAMTTANGAPPGTKTALAASDLYKSGGALQLFADQLAATCGTAAPTPDCVAVPRPLTPAYPVISTAFSKAFFSAFQGGDPQSLLTGAAKTIDLAFKDNNNYK